MSDKQVILIVDDDPRDIAVLTAFLSPQAYRIVRAGTGREALEKLSGRVDLILLDVVLPDTDGFALTVKIRSDPAHRLLPIVLVTALMGREDKLKAIEAGCDGFLSKPVDGEELLARVQSLLQVKVYNDLMREHRKELEIEVDRRTEELRNLTAHLLHAREEERKLVAREIHDELGQVLAALKIDLQWIQKKFSQSTVAVMDKIHDIVGLAD